jgi:putative FmdB family regulatory protein
MPIYEYQARGKDNCTYCSGSFELMQKLSDTEITLCPECHNPVGRKISRPSLASPSPSLQRDTLEKHGFTQFRKVEKGVYEKTAGKGPDIISDKKGT